MSSLIILIRPVQLFIKYSNLPHLQIFVTSLCTRKGNGKTLLKKISELLVIKGTKFIFWHFIISMFFHVLLILTSKTCTDSSSSTFFFFDETVNKHINHQNNLKMRNVKICLLSKMFFNLNYQPWAKIKSINNLALFCICLFIIIFIG